MPQLVFKLATGSPESCWIYFIETSFIEQEVCVFSLGWSPTSLAGPDVMCCENLKCKARQRSWKWFTVPQCSPACLIFVPTCHRGGKNTLVIHNTCEDSLLAAPLILDLVLLAELIQRIELRRDGQPFEVSVQFECASCLLILIDKACIPH
jgi:hypothetical protein